MLSLSLEYPLNANEIVEKINQIKMGTKEWAWKNVNCISGCGINCLYCYAKGMAKHYERCTEDTWKVMQINNKVVDKGFGRVRKANNAPWDIMFPTTHNIFIEEPYFSACVKVLRKLLNAGNTVLVTLKPFLQVVTKLCELFDSFKDQMAFRFTITSNNNEILKVFEPFGPMYEERLESLEYATKHGFATTISIEPLLYETPYTLVDDLTPLLSRRIKG